MSDQPAPQSSDDAIEAVRAAIEDATEIPYLLAERAVEALVTTPDARDALRAELGHDDCVPREYVDMRVSDATEQHARDAEQQHDRAKRAEADAERLHQDLDHCAGTAEHLEAERDRLRDLVEEFLEQHPSGEHWQATAEGGPAGWCAECLAEWPCLFERARAALDGGDGDGS